MLLLLTAILESFTCEALGGADRAQVAKGVVLNAHTSPQQPPTVATQARGSDVTQICLSIPALPFTV